MAETIRHLPMVPRYDWVDAVILKACQWRPFNTYVYWHCRHKELCRIVWWGLVPIASGILGWWLHG